MTAPVQSTEASDRELGWSLWFRLQQAFDEPSLQVLARTREAEGLHAALAAHDPSHFERACTAGLRELSREASAANAPSWMRQRVDALDVHRQQLLELLDPPSRRMRDAIAAVEALKLPDSTSGQIFYGAASAADASSEAGMGALGGALLGSLVLPGIGGALGGAVGAMVGMDKINDRNRRTIERVNHALVELVAAIDELFGRAWDLLVVDSAGRVDRCVHYARSTKAWERLSDVLENADRDRIRRDVEAFIAEHGPYPPALSVLVRTALPPFPSDRAYATRWTSKELELFPTQPQTYEDAGDVELEYGEPDLALAHAERGLQLNPGHVGLAATRIDALAAMGRVDEAERLAREAGHAYGLLPAFSLVIGLLRDDAIDRAVEIVDELLDNGVDPIRLTDAMSRHPRLAELLSRGLLALPTPRDLELARLVAERLPCDQVRHFHGLPPADKLANATREFLSLVTGEWVVYFRDWSVWGNGSTGFAITTKRLLWKCLWEQPVILPLDHSTLGPGKLRAEGRNLVCSNVRVDIEDEQLATATVATIAQLHALLSDRTGR